MSSQLHSIECIAPAKLNLFLHVTGRRANGYHTLQTVFQLLDWGDEMYFERTDVPGVQLAESVPGVNDVDNLILRAATLLNAPNRGALIRIHKHIPMGGGLGGGSSNAASTLLMLNKLWDLGRSIDELAALGIQLGADVPVFVRGHSAWAEGVGEQLRDIELPNHWFVILCPNCHVSTAEIFSAPELTRNTPEITMPAFFAGSARNDLQPVVEARYPAVRNALKLLNKYGPAMMTGSGACVFLALDDEATARQIANECESTFDTVVAKGVNRSPPVISHRN